jgi:hypothetical protein
MDRAVLVERVLDMKTNILAFAQPDQRCWQNAVDHHRMTGASAHVKAVVANPQVDIFTAQRRHVRTESGRTTLRPSGKSGLEPKGHEAERTGAQEIAPTEIDISHDCTSLQLG